MANERPSDQVAVLATIDPDAYTSTGTQGSDWASMENFHQGLAVIMAGTIASSGTLDAVLQQATSSTGAGAKAFSPAKSITQMTTGDNDEQALINFETSELDVANGFNHVRILLTLTTAGGDYGAALLGLNPRFGPASDKDLASVGEIVA